MTTRRAFLKSTAFTASALSLQGMASVETANAETDNPALSTPETDNRKETPYRHRAYLGWITDLASVGEPHVAWPSLRLDAGLMQDYRATFDVMQTLGFNEIVIWGLYVARAWPTDIVSAVTKERGTLVGKLIDLAHAHGLRVLSGLGVYSWGFEEIIRAHPKLSRGNPQAMCASEPQAWEWMRRVIDFVYARFPIDGVSMQSADQGRCRCAQCKAYTDAEYHALLNIRVADYIRSKWPNKVIGVSSWGMDFSDPGALPSLQKMGAKLDYLIDFNDSSHKRGREYRKKVISALKCDFGTLGGPVPESPQHLPRDCWLLPTLKRTGLHLRDLAVDGGRACEYFFHVLANPGDEISMWQAGKMLADPAGDWQKHAHACVEEIYHPAKRELADSLLNLFLRAEEAYFRYLPPDLCGTVSLEPLVSSEPGPPVYLTQRLNAAQRAEYRRELIALQVEAAKLRADMPEKTRIDKILRCLHCVQLDIQAIDNLPENANRGQ